MIERYSREEMKNIWELENKFSCYLKVELAICQAYKEFGEIPEQDYKNIVEKAICSCERDMLFWNNTPQAARERMMYDASRQMMRLRHDERCAHDDRPVRDE